MPQMLLWHIYWSMHTCTYSICQSHPWVSIQVQARIRIPTHQSRCWPAAALRRNSASAHLVTEVPPEHGHMCDHTLVTAALLCSSRAKSLQRDPLGPQGRKYFLSGPALEHQLLAALWDGIGLLVLDSWGLGPPFPSYSVPRGECGWAAHGSSAFAAKNPVSGVGSGHWLSLCPSSWGQGFCFHRESWDQVRGSDGGLEAQKGRRAERR